MNIIESKTEQKLQTALNAAQKRLLNEMNELGFWEGELSGSALATAVAVFALAQVNKNAHLHQIGNGLNWLAQNINPDGGWGDSPMSKSNLSTTLLCWSAFSLADDAETGYKITIYKTESWLKKRIGSLNAEAIASAVLAYYGNDRTFSAPILLFCALANRLGNNPQCWDLVPQLPLELAALPHQLFKWLRLPVVSYAIPALIAIGLAKQQHSNKRPPISYLRNFVRGRTLKILAQIQPSNGGYLEATPLTGFVTMSLASSGYRDFKVTCRGVQFLLQSQRQDGSWPIDTNLATWVTTLSVNAFKAGGKNNSILPQKQCEIIRNWLLNQQHKQEHVFTHAAPGGWSWTDLQGGVPDADDTSGVLLALKNLGAVDVRTQKAAAEGIKWLLNIQNRDGGIPTFCKGWGKLPFDKSCPDITAHALRAFVTWRDELNTALQIRIDKAITAGIRYLAQLQRPDGTWLPLWFGNQWAKNEENPIYGTAQVLMALQHERLSELPAVNALIEKGKQWLLSAQNLDGGWGTTFDKQSTIEETALALNALAGNDDVETVSRGAQWLLNQTDGKNELPAAPIGLYFASLWYYEKLYPLIFTVSALESVLNAN